MVRPLAVKLKREAGYSFRGRNPAIRAKECLSGGGGLAAAYSRFRAVSTMRLHPTGFPWRGHARDGGIKSDDAQVRGWAVRSFSQFSD